MHAKNCNLDYHGGMICREDYPGDSACTRFGGKMLCLHEIKTPVKRDWLSVASDPTKCLMVEPITLPVVRIERLEQVIRCPNCKAGWRRQVGRPNDWRECPVCETRGFLVIDGNKTMARKPLPKPTK